MSLDPRLFDEQGDLQRVLRALVKSELARLSSEITLLATVLARSSFAAQLLPDARLALARWGVALMTWLRVLLGGLCLLWVRRMQHGKCTCYDLI